MADLHASELMDLCSGDYYLTKLTRFGEKRMKPDEIDEESLLFIDETKLIRKARRVVVIAKMKYQRKYTHTEKEIKCLKCAQYLEKLIDVFLRYRHYTSIFSAYDGEERDQETYKKIGMTFMRLISCLCKTSGNYLDDINVEFYMDIFTYLEEISGFEIYTGMAEINFVHSQVDKIDELYMLMDGMETTYGKKELVTYYSGLYRVLYDTEYVDPYGNTY